jgi:transcriptional regulator with XRE-family HTH domain
MRKQKVTNLEWQISERVASARKKAGLSREELGEFLSLEEQSYGHYERGRSAFTIEQLFLVSRVLRVPVEDLLGLPLPDNMSEDERWLLNAYNRLDEQKKRTLRFMAISLSEQAPLSYEQMAQLAAKGFDGQ